MGFFRPVSDIKYALTSGLTKFGSREVPGIPNCIQNLVGKLPDLSIVRIPPTCCNDDQVGI